MRARLQRTHFMGQSNRQTECPKLAPLSDPMDRSYAKSKSFSLYHKTADMSLNKIHPTKDLSATQPNARHTRAFSTNQPKDAALTSSMGVQMRFNPATGSHFQLERLSYPSTHKLDELSAADQIDLKTTHRKTQLDFSHRLNQQVHSLRDFFTGKKVMIQKLEQLKRSFLKHNGSKKSLTSYFEKCCDANGKIGVKELQQLVKDYGYAVNADEAELVLRLTKAQQNCSPNAQGPLHIDLPGFIELMTKPNVHFTTLQVKSPKASFVKFSDKNHIVLFNKYVQLKEALAIYRQREEAIDHQQFEAVFKKLDITDLVVSRAERDQIFREFSPNGQLNPEALLGAIAAQADVNSTKVTQADTQLAFQKNLLYNLEKKARAELHPRQVDFKRLSAAQYETQMRRAYEVLQKIRRINEKTDFLQALGAGAGLDRSEFRDKIEKHLQAQGINFSKQHYDSLTSYVDFDSKDFIGTQNLKKILIDESEKQAMGRFERRLRNPAPQRIQQGSEDGYDHQEAHNSLVRLQNAHNNPEASWFFNALDKDKDGYISREDAEKGLKSLGLAQNESANLINYLIDEAGSLTRKQFQQRVKQIESPASINLEMTSQLRSKSCQDWALTKRSNIHHANLPEENVPSKYSAWPVHKLASDMSLVQASSSTGQHITERQRFDSRTKHDVGMSEKTARMRLYQNKLSRIAGIQQQLSQLREVQRNSEDERVIAKNYALRSAQQQYEHNCHL